METDRSTGNNSFGGPAFIKLKLEKKKKYVGNCH